MSSLVRREIRRTEASEVQATYSTKGTKVMEGVGAPYSVDNQVLQPCVEVTKGLVCAKGLGVLEVDSQKLDSFKPTSPKGAT